MFCLIMKKGSVKKRKSGEIDKFVTDIFSRIFVKRSESMARELSFQISQNSLKQIDLANMACFYHK